MSIALSGLTSSAWLLRVAHLLTSLSGPPHGQIEQWRRTIYLKLKDLIVASEHLSMNGALNFWRVGRPSWLTTWSTDLLSSVLKAPAGQSYNRLKMPQRRRPQRSVPLMLRLVQAMNEQRRKAMS